MTNEEQRLFELLKMQMDDLRAKAVELRYQFDRLTSENDMLRHQLAMNTSGPSKYIPVDEINRSFRPEPFPYHESPMELAVREEEEKRKAALEVKEKQRKQIERDMKKALGRLL